MKIAGKTDKIKNLWIKHGKNIQNWEKSSHLRCDVEQEQRASVNRDSEAIVVGAGRCDREGKTIYTAYA